MRELAETDADAFSQEYVVLLSYAATLIYLLREQREHRVFQQLLHTVPGLEERILNGFDEEIVHIADLVSISSTALSALTTYDISATERRSKRKIRRYQKLEGRDS